MFTNATAATLPEFNTSFGIRADHASLEALAKEVQMPEALPSGQVPVLNKGGGYAILSLDTVSQACVDYCASGNKTLLDIGAGYGTISLPALHNADCTVISADIGTENLLVIRNRASAEDRSRLFLNNQRFPNLLTLPDNSLDAVALSQVLHFLTGAEIEAGLQNIARWLKPDGKLFITTSSPFIKILTAFMPTYQSRVAANLTWPGAIENFNQLRPWMTNLPTFFHVIDHATIEKALVRNGFKVEEMVFVDRRQTIPSLALDGKEDIGVIARR